MSFMVEKDARFTGIEKKVGVFIVFAVVCIVAAVILIGLQREIFTKKVSLYFVADTGTGLTQGMAVKFKGFKVGKVEEVILNRDGKVEVRLSLLQDYLRFIKADSIAALVQEGVIGEFIIELSEGSPDAASVYDGGGLYFERAVSMGDIAKDIKAQAEGVIKEVKKVITMASDPEGDIRKTLSNVRELTDDFKQTRRNVDNLLVTLNKGAGPAIHNANAVLVDVRKEIIPKTGELMNSVSSAVKTSETAVLALQNTVDGLTSKVNRSLDNVISITEDIKRSSIRVPYMVEESTEIMEDTSQVLDSVKKTWPISRNIEDQPVGPLRVDSYE